MSKSSHERAFWEAFANDLSPSWDIKLADEFDPDKMNLQSHDVFAYVVDTRSGSLAGGGTTQAQMISICAQVNALSDTQKSQVLSAVGSMIIEIPRTAQSARGPHVVLCIKAALAALVQTRVYQIVLEKGELAGHWIYLVYQTKSSELIGRPAFFRYAAPGFAPRDVLENMIRQIVAQDTRSPQSSVYQEIAAAGGLALDDDEDQDKPADRERPH